VPGARDQTTWRSRIAAGVLLAASFVFPAPGQDAAAIYRQGVDLQQQGDLAGAAEAYRKSLAIDGTNLAAHSNLGAALVGLGRFNEAIPEYLKAIEVAPDQFRSLLKRNLALAYYKSGRLQDASPILLELHEAEPASHPAALLAADCLLQMGEPARALAVLEPLAPAADSDKALAYLLGLAYLKTGKTADAQRVLDPILNDDSSAEGQFALGIAMFTSRDYPSAVTALGRAVQLNPGLAHVQSYYGQALIYAGDPDGALAAFQKQLEADANDYEANFLSASILSKRGKYADAEPLLRRAVLLRPKASDARLALADTLIGEGKTKEARAELVSTIHEWPELGAAHSRLAGIDKKLGLAADAAREQTLAVKYTPKAAAVPNPDRADPTVGLLRGQTAPVFQLAKADGGGTVRIPSRGKPTVLVFGSYTCPNFRKASPVLNDLAEKLQGSVLFLQVYIREAHATGQWQTTINERESVELAMPSSMDQKNGYAMMCQRKLHLRFPAVVDGLDNSAEKSYAAWPSRVYVIGADGKVRYSSPLNEEDFDGKALEREIRMAAARR
jgi:tetratricopeptide (TPR) repeat protein